MLKKSASSYVIYAMQFFLAEFEEGTGFMEIPKAVRLPQYSHWVGYEEWLEMNTLRLMTDLWMGPFPWIPDAR